MKPKQYRKKPVVIEALLWDGTTSLKTVRDFVGNAYQEAGNDIFIDTLEGKMHVSAGDYIIKGVKGEFYPIKADIFAETYEEVK